MRRKPQRGGLEKQSGTFNERLGSRIGVNCERTIVREARICPLVDPATGEQANNSYTGELQWTTVSREQRAKQYSNARAEAGFRRLTDADPGD